MAREKTPANRKTRKPDSSAQTAIVGLIRTTDLVRRRLTAVVEPQGLTLQQFNVLRILRGAGSSGLPTLSVAERMVEQTPGVTRLLDRLAAKGLVRRERCAADRRQHLCWITHEGLELLRALDAPVLDADEAIMAPLSDEERLTLTGLLDRVREGLPPP